MARLVVARVEEDRKVLEDNPTLVAAAERGKVEDAQERVIFHRQVCFKCGSTDHWARDCPKMDDGSSSSKKRNLGAYACGAWTCNNTDNSRDEERSSDSFQVVLFFLPFFPLFFFFFPLFFCFSFFSWLF